ncbi:hypothetical protein MMC17_003872 [Xylographa soralifera]|nr:hypothetical protein [Xylographa soralifera]
MGAPKPPKRVRQKKPENDRLDFSLEEIKPVYNEYRDCICDLSEYLDDDNRKAEIELCSKKHKRMGKLGGTAGRSTVIVDLEESDSEQTYASFAAVEVPRLAKIVKQQRVRKNRLKYPTTGSKATHNPWDNCFCDSDDSVGSQRRQSWEYCNGHDLLLGVPCKSLTRSRGVVDFKGSATKSSENRALSAKKLLASVPGRVKNSKEVQGKKRKHEENTAKPRLQGQDADLSRRRKISAAVASPPRRSAYDHRTLASDILRAAGKHPTLPPLNWRSMQRYV